MSDYLIDLLLAEDADRIEQLERERKDLGEWRDNLVEDLAKAEAKLAKAVEALRKIAVGEIEFWDEDSGVNVLQWLNDEDMTDIARAALAKLEKQ